MIQVVLTEANILYSRVLRDYLVYAAADGLIRLRWSAEILDEMARNLINRRGLPAGQVERLAEALNLFLPDALVTLGAADYAAFADLPMPDEDDRHVLAAAIAARANVLCTWNTKHFPPAAMEHVRIQLRSPDEVIRELLMVTPHSMRAVHERILKMRGGMPSASLLVALGRAGATDSEKLLRTLLA